MSSAWGKRSLWVGNLPFDMTESDVRMLFMSVAPVVSVRLRFDPASGTSKGCGYVEFADSETCRLVKSVMHGVEVRGRALRLDWATPEFKRHQGKDGLKDITRLGPTDDSSRLASSGVLSAAVNEQAQAEKEITALLNCFSQQQLILLVSYTSLLCRQAPEAAQALLRDHEPFRRALLHALLILNVGPPFGEDLPIVQPETETALPAAEGQPDQPIHVDRTRLAGEQAGPSPQPAAPAISPGKSPSLIPLSAPWAQAVAPASQAPPLVSRHGPSPVYEKPEVSAGVPPYISRPPPSDMGRPLFNVGVTPIVAAPKPPGGMSYMGAMPPHVGPVPSEASGLPYAQRPLFPKSTDGIQGLPPSVMPAQQDMEHSRFAGGGQHRESRPPMEASRGPAAAGEGHGHAMIVETTKRHNGGSLAKQGPQLHPSQKGPVLLQNVGNAHFEQSQSVHVQPPSGPPGMMLAVMDTGPPGMKGTPGNAPPGMVEAGRPRHQRGGTARHHLEEGKSKQRETAASLDLRIPPPQRKSPHRSVPYAARAAAEKVKAAPDHVVDKIIQNRSVLEKVLYVDPESAPGWTEKQKAEVRGIQLSLQKRGIVSVDDIPACASNGNGNGETKGSEPSSDQDRSG